MPIPLDEIVLLPPEEAELAIQAQVPMGFTLALDSTPGYWEARFTAKDGRVLWSAAHLDKRILLFDFYGWMLRHAGAKPQHPAWVRRGEVQIASAHGAKAHQAHVKVPDPEDLEPDEILRVYGIKPRDKDVIK
jgi:hypothetical protein